MILHLNSLFCLEAMTFKRDKILGKGSKKVCKITHLLLPHPPTSLVCKKTKKNMLFFGLFSSFGTKKFFEVFSP